MATAGVGLSFLRLRTLFAINKPYKRYAIANAHMETNTRVNAFMENSSVSYYLTG